MQQVETEKKRRGRPRKIITETVADSLMQEYQKETIEEYRRTVARQEKLINSLISKIEKTKVN